MSNSMIKIVSNELELLDADSYSMLYTLEARALASISFPELNFKDSFAVELKKELNLNNTIDKNLIFSITERTKIFDQAVIAFLKENKNTIIVSLGCGLCSRQYRLRDTTNNLNQQWINIDLEKVIAIRNQLYQYHSETINMSCEDIHEAKWLEKLLLKKTDSILIIMEGVSPYLKQQDLDHLLFNINKKATDQTIKVNLLFDYCHPKYNYSDTELNKTSQKKVLFRAGYKNTNDVQKNALGSSIICTYNNLLLLNNDYAIAETYFRKQNNNEDPYTILNIKFNSEKELVSAPTKLRYFDKPVFWNKKFAQQKVDNGNYLFISEEDHFICSQKEFEIVLDFLTNEKKIYSNFQEEILAVHIVNLFQKLELLIDNENEHNYIFTSFKNDYKTIINNNQQFTLLTEIKQIDILTDLVKNFSIEKIHLVIVDDYLDPRLIKLSNEFKKEKKPWLLLKLSGNQVMIGPMISQLTCYHCLEQHLWRNQPVRKWVSQFINKTQAIPLFFSKELLVNQQDAIQLEIKNIVENSKQSELTTINLTTSKIQNHPVQQRVLCSHCGDSNLIIRNNVSPIELQSSKKIESTDGGYRSVEQSQSLKNLKSIISPLTGYIHSLNCLTESQDNLSIYSTSFVKYPHKKSLLTNDDFIQYSLGKGIKKDQSKMSALSETIERYNALYDGTEECVYAKADELNCKSFLPNQLKYYSEQQILKFRQNLDSKQAVKEMPKDVSLHWTPAFSLLNQEKIFLPFTYCYANTPFEDEKYVRFDSNGCAAGNTIEEAILQGFLEVIERDAIAVWWYNKVLRPSVNLDDLDTVDLSIIKKTLDKNWDYWVLDLSHDFNIPVVVAVGKNKDTNEFRLGFGAHLEISIACTRALTELYQVIVINKQHKTIFNFQQIENLPFLFPKPQTAPIKFDLYSTITNSDIKSDIEYCIEQTKKIGLNIFIVNTTRPNIPLHTVKIIIPGLNFIWPELGNKRLYELPVLLKWQSVQLSESELNKHELFL